MPEIPIENVTSSLDSASGRLMQRYCIYTVTLKQLLVLGRIGWGDRARRGLVLSNEYAWFREATSPRRRRNAACRALMIVACSPLCREMDAGGVSRSTPAESNEPNVAFRAALLDHAPSVERRQLGRRHRLTEHTRHPRYKLDGGVIDSFVISLNRSSSRKHVR